MNHDATIQAIIKDIKADVSIVQPWRNYAIKSMNEAQAFVRMGKTTTYAEAPQGTFANETSNDTFSDGKTILEPSAQATGQQNGTCTCPVGGRRTTCPVHGEGATNGGCICTELGRRKDCLVHGGQA